MTTPDAFPPGLEGYTARGWLPDGRQVILSDYPDADSAKAALAVALAWNWPDRPYGSTELDVIADVLAATAGQDTRRPYGFGLDIQ